MSSLIRFILDDGAFLVACCDDGSWPSHPNRFAAVDEQESFVTLVSDTAVRTIPPERIEAILPVESSFQIPLDLSVYRFVLIA